MQLVWLILIPLVSPYNFLVFNPNFGHSHTNYLSKIADTLTDAGHNVTILMPVADKRLFHKTGAKTTRDIIKFEPSEKLARLVEVWFSGLGGLTWEQSADYNIMKAVGQRMTDAFEQLCKETLERTELIEELKSRKFDVGFAEPITLCGLGFIKGLGIPASIAAVSTPPLEPISKYLGQPIIPSYVPVAMSSGGDRMSWWERLKNVQNLWDSEEMFDRNFAAEYPVLVKKFGNKIGSIEDLISGVSFQFINTNPYLDFPFPTIQKNVAISGIQVNTEVIEVVDAKFDAILSERKSTILISFGSIARSVEMPEKYKKSLLEVFASMPDTTFIWKYEEEGSDIVSHLKNVHLSSWVPQKALLGDSRLSVFLTHGGLGSTTELAYFGRPAIVIPLFGDQPRNAAMLCRHGGAVQLDKFDLARPEIIRNTFERVLNDSSYASNAKRLADMLTSQPFKASELVVKHSEFAAKFGSLPNLDPYGRQLNFVQYFMLDIIFAFIVVIVSVLYITWRLFTQFSMGKSKLE